MNVRNLSRRKFSQFALFLGVGGLLGRDLVFQAKFKIDLSHYESPEEFYASQSKHENTDKIVELNSNFKRTGKLLSFNHYREGQELVWDYKFDTEESFVEWEKSLYKLGLVDNTGRSVLPQRLFAYKLS